MISSDTDFSLSIFVLEADRKPLLAFTAKTYDRAEEFCADERVRSTLRGGSLCGDYSILRIRMARPEEHALYRQQKDSVSMVGGLQAVYLIDAEGAAILQLQSLTSQPPP